MKNALSILFFVIGVSSFNIERIPQKDLGEKIFGKWEYYKISIEGKTIYVGLDSCGWKDTLEISQSKNHQIIEYEFNEVQIVGEEIGISNRLICDFDDIAQEFQLRRNSCPTFWIRLKDNPKGIVCVSEGVAAEYEITKVNRRNMTIKMKREIMNYGLKLPEKIEFKRAK